MEKGRESGTSSAAYPTSGHPFGKEAHERGMSAPSLSLTVLCAVNRKREEEAVRPNQRSKRSVRAHV